MGPEIVNRNKDNEFHGNYAGRDLINHNYYILFKDDERERVVTHNAYIAPSVYFTGRSTELEELRHRIEEGRKSVLVSGMGGIGKTHICRTLFKEYYDQIARDKEAAFQYLGYIEYDTDMDSSLLRCLKFKRQENPEQDVEAAWRELEYLASGGRLLLIIDNVNISIQKDSGLERLSSIPGAIILSSRLTSFGRAFEPYPIGFLSLDQCIDIYEKIRFDNSGRKVKEEETKDLKYIIDQLAARHTITVEFLARLARVKLWPAEKLRRQLEENGFRLIFHEDQELINIQESYEILYDLSELSGTEQNILEAFSVFPYIPLPVEVCNRWLLDDAGAKEEDDILYGLYYKGWLQFDSDLEGYSMHPVYTQFIYERCKPNEKDHQLLMQACEDSLAIPEDGNILKCQAYIPFVESFLKKVQSSEVFSKVNLMDALGYLLYQSAEYEKAEELYLNVVSKRKSALGEKHPDTASSYNNLAGVYGSQGAYEKAEELYKKSLKITEEVLGEKHPNTATGYNNLAGVYQSQGAYKKAEELYEKSLKITKEVLGEKHPNTATGYKNLAGVYQSQGAYKKAEELYKKSLKIMKEVLGEQHPSTATGYHSLAFVYASQGAYKKAEELYKKSLKIIEEVLGEKHPDTASGYNNLAGVYESQKDYKKAKELYKKSLKITEEVLGENHPDTAVSYHNLAFMYASQGAYKKAEELYEKSLKIMKEVLGEQHPSTATGYHSLAFAYASQGAYKKAEELYEKSLKIMKKVLGEKHPDTASSYNNLAEVYVSLGDYKKAKELYEKSLKIREEVLGENHPSTATSYHNLAGVYQSQGSYEEAEELYEKSLNIIEEVLGENHPNTATSYNNLAGVYQSQGSYEKAEKLYEKSLNITEEVLGEKHPVTATSYHNLAGVYQSQGSYEKAEELYEKGLKITEEVLGKKHPSTAISYHNLAINYLHKKNYDRAISLLQIAISIILQTLGLNHPNTLQFIKNYLLCAKAMEGNQFDLDKWMKKILPEDE